MMAVCICKPVRGGFAFFIFLPVRRGMKTDLENNFDLKYRPFYFMIYISDK